MADRLRMALVGAGRFAEMHLRAHAQAGVAEVVAIVDPDVDRARHLASRYGVGGTFSSHSEMLDVVKPDAVSVVCAEEAHFEVGLACLRGGVPTLMEKPLTTTVADAQELVALARETHTLLMAAHVLRFAVPFQTLKAAVELGQIGSVLAVVARRDRPADIGRRGVHPALLSLVHDIDLLLWLTGSRATTVRALACSPDAGAHPRLVMAQIELQSGAIASLSAGWLHPEGSTPATSDRFEVYGSRGVASADMSVRPVEIKSTTTQMPDVMILPEDGTGALQREVTHFCDLVRRGAPTSVVPMNDAVHGIEIARAIAQSSDAGGVIVRVPAATRR